MFVSPSTNYNKNTFQNSGMGIYIQYFADPRAL